MTTDFGPGVSRTLDAMFRQFQTVVWQAGKPPLDSESNLSQQVGSEEFQQLVRSQIHSGFFLDPTRPLDDFVTDALNSNQFRFGQQKRDENGDVEELAPVVWANLNGMLIPVIGTNNTETDATDNIVTLNPPPTSDTRIDFIFLEAWRVLVDPNPSTANKPAADKIWKYGNVEFGQTNLDDDLEDPAVGFPTTLRVQIQYRIRVVGEGSGAGVSPDLAVFPDGLDDPNVRAQGPLANPSAQAYAVFTNMRNDLGDPSLWRAGDGDPTNDFETVDGYVFAVPIGAVFRRNSSPYVAVNLAGNPNQNGAFNRNPSAVLLTDPRDGAKLFTQASLSNDLPAEQTSIVLDVEVDGLVGSGFDDPNLVLSTVFMVIDNEVVAIDSIDITVSPALIRIPAGGRGRWGTDPLSHSGRSDPLIEGSGTSIYFFNTRPEVKSPYSDEVQAEDIFDMRRGVNMGDWDYERILLHNVSALMRNRLRSTWKQTGVPGGDTEGVTVQEVDWLDQDGSTPNPNGTEALDGPDGIRYLWSDAAVYQGRVTMLLNPSATMNSGFIQTLDDAVNWDAGADFKPSAFMNNLNNATPGFTDGTTLFVYIGGDSGSVGARKTFRDGTTRAVRFVGPKEFWKAADANTSDVGFQHPVSIVWNSTDQANLGVQTAGGGLQSLQVAGPGETLGAHPGPMYPIRDQNFEKPFIVLGGVVNGALVVTGIDPTTNLRDNSTDPGTIPLGEGEIVLPGFNFDTAGDWYSLAPNGDFANDPSAVNFPLVRGSRTLFDMLTAGGKDETGSSSELYLIMYGDDQALPNNGAFQVIGAGTVGYTSNSGGSVDGLRVRFLTQGVTLFDVTSTGTLTAEGRSMEHNAEDGDGSTSGPSAMTITMTDLEAVAGGASNPWNVANINPGTSAGFTLEDPFDFKAVVNTTLLYYPGRPAMARVPDEMQRVTMQSAPAQILRQSAANLDSAFPGETGAPGNPPESNFTFTHIQLFNRLPSLGLDAPTAPAYGGNVVLNSEVTRETEAFFDRGSKTLLFRPFQDLSMTMKGITIQNPTASASLLGTDTIAFPNGSTQYPNPALIPNGWDGPKDDAQVFTTGLLGGYTTPHQWMPRFGRQDIPYFQDNGAIYGTGRFLEGINHLFTDGTDLTNPVFNVIGGPDNVSGGALVTRMLLQTGTTSGFKFAQFGNITGPTTPAYQGRLTSEIGSATAAAESITNKLDNVTSSDFGKGLSGIQLPPYLGIARLYGVYDRRDFVAQGAVTFAADRVTPLANRAINLLRRDATKQTLFLCEDGAFDLTGERGDHTYIVPFSSIDITKSPDLVAGETEEDLEYVLEFTSFGFSHGWVNENNFVMTRRHDGQGVLVADGDNLELQNIRMSIAHAAPDSSTVYTAYDRTVYQGDPYMTRAGDTRTTTDYEHVTGQVAQSNAFGLATPIQQFDDDGNQIPERPNARSLQVLSSLDFYTTMGSGNIGGSLYPGTETDVGYTQDDAQSSTRIPPAVATPPWRVLTRTFSEGQKENKDRAALDLRIDGNNATFVFGTSAVEIRKLDGTLVTFTAFNGVTVDPAQFDASSPDEVVIAKELTAKINARTELLDTVYARNDIDDQVLRLSARPVGSEGNGIRVSINDTTNFTLLVPKSGVETLDATITTAYMAGGDDLPVNAGSGTTKLDLTGMTERMPLGILVRDQDFLGENPLQDLASAVQMTLGGIRPNQQLLPLTESGGEEFTTFTGGPGELTGMGDGSILQYTAFDADTNPGGSKRYRIFRGGGSVFVLSGRNPGGPLDWTSSGLEPPLEPVLKGGVLVAKAVLVRNFFEQAFSTDDTTTEGDEIQMLLLTQAHLGDGATTTEGVELDGIISPTGYGEGVTSSDRYRLNGHPMFTGRIRVTPDPQTTPLAPFTEEFDD